MRFTYSDTDEQRILGLIQDPIKRKLVKMLFEYAGQCGGLSEQEFNEIQKLANEATHG